MKYLVIALDFPIPANNGHRLRNWSLLRALAQQGNEVSLLCFSSPGEPTERSMAAVREVCASIWTVPLSQRRRSASKEYASAFRALFGPVPYSVLRFKSTDFERALRQILEGDSFDGLFCETCYPLINVPLDVKTPLIVDNHNIEHLLIQRFRTHTRDVVRRVYAGLEWRRLRTWEVSCWLRARCLGFCSEHDRAICVRLCGHSGASVVPNVIDVDHYVPNPGGGAGILFIGGMDWLPNRDAVQFFAREILPKIRECVPAAQFLVAGRPSGSTFENELSALGISFTGAVSDMRPVIAESAICVVPLRIGSGTRLKILEAAASGKAIVSTPLGAEGLTLRDGADIVLASNAEEFATRVSHLLSSREERLLLGSSARRAVEEQYGFNVLSSRLRACLAPFEENT